MNFQGRYLKENSKLKETPAIQITDLKAQYIPIADEIDAAIHEVIGRCQFVLGPEVTALEREIAAYCRTDYAVGVASGTDALRLALLACGIGSGDEVITTPFTFVSTVETIVECGAIPVFVDIDPRTYNMNTDIIEAKISLKTKAILPVHLYGQSVDMDPILQLAWRYGLHIIEDCAQALGAEYKGRRVGSFGNAGCLSFYPSKNLGAYGDGGMVVTDSVSIAETVRVLRKHGARSGNHYTTLGYNSRLDTLQAAILSVKLKRLDQWINLRRQKANLYKKLLDGIDGIVPAYAEEYNMHAYNYYTILIEATVLQRDELKAYLAARGIQTIVYYPVALHLQDVYRYLGYTMGDFPVTERVQDQVLSLPMFPEITTEQIETVVDGIKEFVQSRQFELVV
jgi:dTDP-4-amino-4,6-dideoxygalactose transaminase